jgi:hypothetical protein
MAVYIILMQRLGVDPLFWKKKTRYMAKNQLLFIFEKKWARCYLMWDFCCEKYMYLKQKNLPETCVSTTSSDRK